MNVEQLIHDHRPILLRFACRILRNFDDAEDAVQRASLRAFRGADRFRGECDPKSWLVRIVMSECFMILRSGRSQLNSRTDSLEEVNLSAIVDTRWTPEKYASEEERFRLIYGQFDKLSPKLRNALNDQLAGNRTSGISVNAHKSRIHRARQLLIANLRKANMGELASL